MAFKIIAGIMLSWAVFYTLSYAKSVRRSGNVSGAVALCACCAIAAVEYVIYLII